MTTVLALAPMLACCGFCHAKCPPNDEPPHNPHLPLTPPSPPQGKPAPDVYYEALRRAGCTDPRRAVVIEDTVNGLMSARAAGAFAVGVTNSLPSDVLAPHAHMVVSHLSELDLATLVPDRLCCPE